MSEQYKTTFNYLLTNKIMPRTFFSNLALFYEKIIINPKNIQLFMKNCVKTSIEIAKKNPDVEPGTNPDWALIEQFKMELMGELGKNIILISIPCCNKNNDCLYIAIPCAQEAARYFTCELSSNPANGESFFIAGEWTQDNRHLNFGQTGSGRDSFAARVIKMVYGDKKNTDSPISNNEIENLLAGIDKKPQGHSQDSRDEELLDEDFDEDDEEDNYEKITALADTGWACYRNGKLKEALEKFNNLLETENSEAAYFHCRSVIHRALGSETAADYDLFRAKHIDMTDNGGKQTETEIPVEKLENKFGLEQRRPLFAAEKRHDTMQNKDGKPLLRVKANEGEARLPEIFYSGGKNALLRRRMDQYIFLGEIKKEAREMLCKNPEITVAELIPAGEKKDNGIIREYQAAVRLLPEIINMDSIEDICTDGYLLFTSLVSLLRANSGKRISDVIAKDDLPNLAAILVREEDYQLLDKYFAEGLPVNERISRQFKSWQPTPLFYITLHKIWSLMKDPVKMLKYLQKNKTDFDLASFEGDTPLGNQCTQNGSLEIMKALLDCGADPNADTTSEGYSIKPLQLVLFPNDYDEEKQTFKPYRAVDAEKAKLLIETAADVNADNDGMTPLVQAITYGRGTQRAEIITLLRKKGADVNTALKYMEELAKEGSPIFSYALYEFYAGFPDNKTPMPGMSAWKDTKTARYYLELSAQAGYEPAINLLK